MILLKLLFSLRKNLITFESNIDVDKSIELKRLIHGDSVANWFLHPPSLQQWLSNRISPSEVSKHLH